MNYVEKTYSPNKVDFIIFQHIFFSPFLVFSLHLEIMISINIVSANLFVKINSVL